MRCAKCNADNRDAAKFCDKCGARLSPRCPSCGAENRPDARFCDSCGAALGTSAEAGAAKKSDDSQIRIADAPSAENIDGERKTVTALFADIKGSTELMEDLDPEAARAIVDPALKLMIEAVRRYDGYVVQSTGDGIFALFGAPVAHEDHPQRALYAALRLQEELRRYSDRIRQEGRLPLQARVGANTGEVVVRSIQTGAAHTEYTPIGHTANLASRMQALAPIGSIAVTETTRGLCEGYFILRSLGPTRVKGLGEPVNVYEVTGLGPLRTRLQRSAGRGLTKFVGRQREMEALRHALEQSKAGRGQIVAAMAEPGVGKSRLFFEFKAVSQSGCMVLEAFSVSHGKASAYLPILDLLHGYFRLSGEDDPRTRREKVAGRITILDRVLEDTLPYLFGLLGIVEGEDPLAQMDGQVKKRRTLEAIKRILLRESLNQPLMVIFEDLHWIDEQTQEFLNLLADSIGTAKILLLVNYRPEYTHHWNSKTYYTQLRLDPLGSESADEMLAALLGDEAELVPLKRLIIEKTEGTPFFMEETVQVLLDEGALVRNGAVHLTRPLAELKIPPTVQGILASRIDRLPADAKDLLQTLAVIGREFPLSLIRAVVTKSDDELNRLLNDLQLAEFIYEQPAVGDTEYIFKHALTQEVAYVSVLSDRRKQIHEHAAQANETLFATDLADRYEDLAHHYRRSGNAEKAIEYSVLAAEKAASRSAYAEASELLTRALELLAKQPDSAQRDRSEIDVLCLLANCIWVSGRYTEITPLDLLERARELAEKTGDFERRCETLDALALHYGELLEHNRVHALLGELLGIARSVQDSEKEGQVLAGLGVTFMREGNFVAALEAFDQAEKCASSGHEDFGNWRSLARAFHCMTLWYLGYPERAKARSEVSLALARRTSPAALAWALLGSVVLHVYLKNSTIACAYADEGINLEQEHGISFLLHYTGFWRGWALVQTGQLRDGLAEMSRWQGEAEQPGLTSHNPLTIKLVKAVTGYYCEGIADCHLVAGDTREAIEAAGRGLEVGRQTGSQQFEAELLRLKGEALLMNDNGSSAEAAECFREAIAVAHQQSAKSWELRATMSLARLLRDTNRRDEARAMLAEIYGWFTEGFDTADLIDAKALLDELST